MNRNLFALCALLLFTQSVLAQDSSRQRPASELAYSTAAVSTDSLGEVGGDFTNGFFPNERLDLPQEDILDGYLEWLELGKPQG